MTFVLTVLGSSSALPTSKRYPTAHALNVHERFFLIDCGEGAQIQMRKNKIPFGRLNHIFISHLHGDHYFGLFGLISSFSLLGRTNDLHIYSPTGLEHLIKTQFTHTGYVLSYNIVFHILTGTEPVLIFEDKILTVHSFPLKHKLPTFGFIFREKKMPKNMLREMINFYKIPIKEIIKIKEGADFYTEEGVIVRNEYLTKDSPNPRSYVYCSDTIYNEDIIPWIKGVNLLYHESTFADDMKERAVNTWHSTAKQAAQIASKSEVKQLIIGHFSARYNDIEIFLEEARSIFENTTAGEDDMSFVLKQN